MVLSCLTVYVIVFSCVSLLIGRSYAATPIQMEITGRHNDKRSTKIHVHNNIKTSNSNETAENLKSVNLAKEGSKVLQSSYAPSNLTKIEKLSNDTIRLLNDSHSYFALFDPVKNVTKKFDLGNLNPNPPPIISQSEIERLQKSEGNSQKAVKNHGNNYFGAPIKNFVVYDTLEDSEKEIRIHFKGITAKETEVKTGRDEDTGKWVGLKLRQLTDGKHFIQLIYTSDNQLQDCEYIKQKSAVLKFLNGFKDDIEKAKVSYQTEEKEVKSHNFLNENDEEDEFFEDEGKIESYYSEDDDMDEMYMETEFRNVTFQIIRQEEDLPKDIAEWMNYPMLKKQCKENHRILKKLAYNKKHGDENAKKLANEHIERVKRNLDYVMIFPGTKWCGKSNMAEKYTALGGFSKTDKCCRAHDHCHPLIASFQEKYGFFNFRPFTISHCRCDLRRKRDIMDVLLVPGTKWCGKGRRATKYTSLGGFSKTDKCCRIHDTMCPHWIGSLEEKYGLFNWRINTIMHCRCDKRFRACLKMAKTGTANFVGKLFFNVVQTKCFVLKPQEVCSKYSWWGTCEKKEYRKKAYLKDNLAY